MRKLTAGLISALITVIGVLPAFAQEGDGGPDRFTVEGLQVQDTSTGVMVPVVIDVTSHDGKFSMAYQSTEGAQSEVSGRVTFNEHSGRIQNVTRESDGVCVQNVSSRGNSSHGPGC